jgi:hypothetical protein
MVVVVVVVVFFFKLTAIISLAKAEFPAYDRVDPTVVAPVIQLTTVEKRRKREHNVSMACVVLASKTIQQDHTEPLTFLQRPRPTDRQATD